MPYDPEDLTRLLRSKIAICECDGCVAYDRGPCWVFAVIDRYGYGAWKFRGKYVRAHRAVYERLVGDIPEGLDLDHLCDRHRNCVNPDHLEPVTKLTNTLRANDRRWHGLVVHPTDTSLVDTLYPLPSPQEESSWQPPNGADLPPL